MVADHGGRRGDFEPYGRPAAGWVRFRRCEVRGGVLRPARDAAPEPYDPWDGYRAARAGWGGGGGPAPYESLLELVWSIRLGPGRRGEPVRLDPASERAVTAWCAAHGLLGLLPHEAEVAHLAPRWGAIAEYAEAGASLVPVRRSYSWGPFGWTWADESWQHTHVPELDWTPKREGAVVPTQVRSEFWEAPAVLGRTLGGGDLRAEPLGLAWGQYFPDVPAAEGDAHRYPLPLSDAFWAAYGEPVDAFLLAAALFSTTLQDLDPLPRDGEEPLAFAHRRDRADQAFFGLTAGVQPAFGVATDGGVARAWRAKSLLASFAMMAYLDLTSGMRILACQVCAKPFVTRAYQARYCSARCRHTATKRAYRGRRRERGAADFALAAPDENGAAARGERRDEGW